MEQDTISIKIWKRGHHTDTDTDADAHNNCLYLGTHKNFTSWRCKRMWSRQ